MKTILYNPIFINPQAYYVFPRLTRYLQPDNESTAEPANYIGTIEVKVIAYGDTTLKRTYTNTDSIDLSEFKNTWIRISLFTKVGSCVLGEWKIGNMESDLPYIDPEVLASLKAVVIVGNKTNNDSDRAIIKNLVDPDNPFIISNAAFKLNSGFGKYEEDFTDWRIYPNIKVTDSVVTTDGNFKSSWFIYKHSSESKINEMNIKVSGIPKGGKILYFYISDETANMPIAYTIPKDAYLRANLYLNNNVDEPAEFTFNGVSIGYSRSITVDTAFNIGHIYNYDSPQEVNITIDEYIRYEDIVQPYPVLLRFNDESGKEVSWGGKFRVGSTITRIGSAADSNLLPNIYNIFGLLLNDNQVTSSKVIVEKTMVFKAKSAYIFDNNEPKVILSPSRLRIPNSSYKILGYIPDISGHGNHGVIHNSAYTGMSGANGYTEDFTKWTLYTGVKCTDSIISLDSSFNKQDQWILFKPKGSNINQFTINIKGIPDGGNLYLRLSTDSNIKLENGINEISSYTNVTNSTGFFIGANGLNLDWSNLVIEQVGEYEGAYCLDGVDDFVTIPTVTGGKQVLMKVNWQSIAGTAILYDQRTNGGFAIFNRDYDTNENKVPAYRARNIGGNTYIDGILNEYIYASQLQNITHNIVELYDPELNIGTLNPKIGSSYLNSNYAQMSLYDFMLFDNISTDDKIKELNEYVGIEGNT